MNKSTFPQNPFFVFCSNFVYNKVAAPCSNRLPWRVSKDCSSVYILFLLNSNDTSKIRDGDDNRRDKIFQIQIGQNIFNMPTITF